MRMLDVSAATRGLDNTNTVYFCGSLHPQRRMSIEVHVHVELKDPHLRLLAVPNITNTRL